MLQAPEGCKHHFHCLYHWCCGLHCWHSGCLARLGSPSWPRWLEGQPLLKPSETLGLTCTLFRVSTSALPLLKSPLAFPSRAGACPSLDYHQQTVAAHTVITCQMHTECMHSVCIHSSHVMLHGEHHLTLTPLQKLVQLAKQGSRPAPCQYSGNHCMNFLCSKRPSV